MLLQAPQGGRHRVPSIHPTPLLHPFPQRHCRANASKASRGSHLLQEPWDGLSGHMKSILLKPNILMHSLYTEAEGVA